MPEGCRRIQDCAAIMIPALIWLKADYQLVQELKSFLSVKVSPSGDRHSCLTDTELELLSV